MGFLGSIIGWDQTKDAHNAVLASHLAETASPQLKRAIGDRIVIIQQQVAHLGTQDRIIADLNGRPRMVQANFIALACNSLGIPGPYGLSFGSVNNPYRSDSQSSRARINIAVADLSRRTGRSMSWPGHDVRIDFSSWVVPAAEHSHVSTSREINLRRSVGLAYQYLFAEAFDKEAISRVAQELLANDSYGSDYELALSTAGFILSLEEIIPHAFPLQLGARVAAAEWLAEGKISPAVASYFENTMYDAYRSHTG